MRLLRILTCLTLIKSARAMASVADTVLTIGADMLEKLEAE